MKITIKRHGGDKTQIPAKLPVIMKRAHTRASYTIPYSILAVPKPNVKKKYDKNKKK
jgi:hypothetical protein